MSRFLSQLIAVVVLTIVMSLSLEVVFAQSTAVSSIDPNKLSEAELRSKALDLDPASIQSAGPSAIAIILDEIIKAASDPAKGEAGRKRLRALKSDQIIQNFDKVSKYAGYLEPSEILVAANAKFSSKLTVLQLAAESRISPDGAIVLPDGKSLSLGEHPKAVSIIARKISDKEFSFIIDEREFRGDYSKVRQVDPAAAKELGLDEKSAKDGFLVTTKSGSVAAVIPGGEKEKSRSFQVDGDSFKLPSKDDRLRFGLGEVIPQSDGLVVKVAKDLISFEGEGSYVDPKNRIRNREGILSISFSGGLISSVKASDAEADFGVSKSKDGAMSQKAHFDGAGSVSLGPDSRPVRAVLDPVKGRESFIVDFGPQGQKSDCITAQTKGIRLNVAFGEPSGALADVSRHSRLLGQIQKAELMIEALRSKKAPASAIDSAVKSLSKIRSEADLLAKSISGQQKGEGFVLISREGGSSRIFGMGQLVIRQVDIELSSYAKSHFSMAYAGSTADIRAYAPPSQPDVIDVVQRSSTGETTTLKYLNRDGKIVAQISGGNAGSGAGLSTLGVLVSNGNADPSGRSSVFGSLKSGSYQGGMSTFLDIGDSARLTGSIPQTSQEAAARLKEALSKGDLDEARRLARGMAKDGKDALAQDDPMMQALLALDDPSLSDEQKRNAKFLLKASGVPIELSSVQEKADFEKFRKQLERFSDLASAFGPISKKIQDGDREGAIAALDGIKGEGRSRALALMSRLLEQEALDIAAKGGDPKQAADRAARALEELMKSASPEEAARLALRIADIRAGNLKVFTADELSRVDGTILSLTKTPGGKEIIKAGVAKADAGPGVGSFLWMAATVPFEKLSEAVKEASKFAAEKIPMLESAVDIKEVFRDSYGIDVDDVPGLSKRLDGINDQIADIAYRRQLMSDLERKRDDSPELFSSDDARKLASLGREQAQANDRLKGSFQDITSWQVEIQKYNELQGKRGAYQAFEQKASVDPVEAIATLAKKSGDDSKFKKVDSTLSLLGRLAPMDKLAGMEKEDFDGLPSEWRAVAASRAILGAGDWRKEIAADYVNALEKIDTARIEQGLPRLTDSQREQTKRDLGRLANEYAVIATDAMSQIKAATHSVPDFSNFEYLASKTAAMVGSAKELASAESLDLAGMSSQEIKAVNERLARQLGVERVSAISSVGKLDSLNNQYSLELNEGLSDADKTDSMFLLSLDRLRSDSLTDIERAQQNILATRGSLEAVRGPLSGDTTLYDAWLQIEAADPQAAMAAGVAGDIVALNGVNGLVGKATMAARIKEAETMAEMLKSQQVAGGVEAVGDIAVRAKAWEDRAAALKAIRDISPELSKVTGTQADFLQQQLDKAETLLRFTGKRLGITDQVADIAQGLELRVASAESAFGMQRTLDALVDRSLTAESAFSSQAPLRLHESPIELDYTKLEPKAFEFTDELGRTQTAVLDGRAQAYLNLCRLNGFTDCGIAGSDARRALQGRVSTNIGQGSDVDLVLPSWTRFGEGLEHKFEEAISNKYNEFYDELRKIFPKDLTDPLGEDGKILIPDPGESFNRLILDAGGRVAGETQYIDDVNNGVLRLVNPENSPFDQRQALRQARMATELDEPLAIDWASYQPNLDWIKDNLANRPAQRLMAYDTDYREFEKHVLKIFLNTKNPDLAIDILKQNGMYQPLKTMGYDLEEMVRRTSGAISQGSQVTMPELEQVLLRKPKYNEVPYTISSIDDVVQRVPEATQIPKEDLDALLYQHGMLPESYNAKKLHMKADALDAFTTDVIIRSRTPTTIEDLGSKVNAKVAQVPKGLIVDMYTDFAVQFPQMGPRVREMMAVRAVELGQMAAEPLHAGMAKAVEFPDFLAANKIIRQGEKIMPEVLAAHSDGAKPLVQIYHEIKKANLGFRVGNRNTAQIREQWLKAGIIR